MKYKLNENGIIKEIDPEVWGWRAIYHDGTELRQFADDGTYNKFCAIDKAKIAVLELIKLADPRKRYTLDVSNGAQFFHFYRRTRLYALTPDEKRITLYCFGFKIEGTSIYHFVLPDDRLIITTNRDIKLIY